MRQFGWAIFFLLFAATVSWTQVTEGGLNGYVLDPKGNVLANSQVTVTRVGTGQQRVVSTDANGFYQVQFLIPGTYELKAVHEGFSTGLVKGIQVQTNGLAMLPLLGSAAPPVAAVSIPQPVPAAGRPPAASPGWPVYWPAATDATKPTTPRGVPRHRPPSDGGRTPPSCGAATGRSVDQTS